MPQPVHLSLSNIQHVGIPVTNIEISENFYAGLGFTNVMQANFLHNNETGICIMMQQGDIIIELYQMPDAELASIANRKDGHIDHIAFDVADIDATFQTLSNAGYNIIEASPVFLQFWERGCKYFNILGPDNGRLEFNQVL